VQDRFSISLVAFGKLQLRLDPGELQTLAFVTLVFGNHALLYVPGNAAFCGVRNPACGYAILPTDIAIVSLRALSGTLMAPLPWCLMVASFLGAAGFALILDPIKLVMPAFNVE
jgi:H+-transporting ATPase